MGGNKETTDRGFSHYGGGYPAGGGYQYPPSYGYGGYPPQGGYGYPPPGPAYPPAVGYSPVGYPAHSTAYHSGMGAWLGGGVAGGHGAQHLSHGSHQLTHGHGYYGGGGYGHHGKFKHGKFGKHGGFKKWK